MPEADTVVRKTENGDQQFDSHYGIGHVSCSGFSQGLFGEDLLDN
jgi:hypothetical protein